LTVPLQKKIYSNDIRWTNPDSGTVASGSASGGLQVGHSGLFATVRHGSSIPGRRLSAAFCQLKDMCRQKDLQQLWTQMFCCCRSEAVEQSASSFQTNCRH